MAFVNEPQWYSEEKQYWSQEQHPERLAMPEREAWHRDAWDREQVALYEVTSPSGHAAYSPPPVEQCGEVWQR